MNVTLAQETIPLDGDGVVVIEQETPDIVETVIYGLLATIVAAITVLWRVSGQGIEAARGGLPEWAVPGGFSVALGLARMTPGTKDDDAIEKAALDIGLVKDSINGIPIFRLPDPPPTTEDDLPDNGALG